MQTGNLDGQGLAELRGYKFQNLSAAPTTNLYEGRFYMNTSDHTLYVYNGSAWVDALSQGRVYLAGAGIDATALANGTIAVDTTIASKTDIHDGSTIFKKNGTAFATITANQTSTVNVNYTIPTTASDVNAVPTSRKINGYTLTADVSLTAADVSALPSSTVIGDGKVIFQKNGTSFSTVSANQTATTTVNFTIPTQASDIGALPDTTTIGAANTTIQRNGTAIGTINANATTASVINLSVPTSASDINALPSSTTITDLVSTTQMNAINSGITASGVTAISTNTSGIAAINSLIPSATSTTNKLADKAFVNSSVQTATANFRGNWATWPAVPSSANDYPEDYTGSKTPTVNDYLVVQDASGYMGETLSGTWRFKYSGEWTTNGKSGWLPEYQVNETPMTAAQLAAINSGITDVLVTQISTNTSAISGKQDTLTAGSNITISGNTISATDTTYSAGANISITNGTISATDTIYTLPAATTSSLGGVIVGNNLSISGGTLSATDTIYTLPAATTSTLGGIIVGTNLSINNGVLSADAQSITVDTTLSTTSTNPVQNKVVTSAIAAKSSVTFVDWTV